MVTIGPIRLVLEKVESIADKSTVLTFAEAEEGTLMHQRIILEFPLKKFPPQTVKEVMRKRGGIFELMLKG